MVLFLSVGVNIISSLLLKLGNKKNRLDLNYTWNNKNDDSWYMIWTFCMLYRRCFINAIHFIENKSILCNQHYQLTFADKSECHKSEVQGQSAYKWGMILKPIFISLTIHVLQKSEASSGKAIGDVLIALSLAILEKESKNVACCPNRTFHTLPSMIINQGAGAPQRS